MNQAELSLRKIQKQAAISSAAKLEQIKPFRKTNLASLYVERQMLSHIKAASVLASDQIATEISYEIKSINFERERQKTPANLKHFSGLNIPEKCVYLYQGNYEGEPCLCIIQEPPMKRTIQGDTLPLKDRRAKKQTVNRKLYNIQFPYVNYIISYILKNEKLYVGVMGIGFSQKAFTNIDDAISKESLPHCSLHHVCMPFPHNHNSGYINLKECSQALIANFWNSAFVYAFASNFILSNGPHVEDVVRIDSFESWEKYVKTPEDILNADFGSTTFRNVINQRIVFSRPNSDPIKDFRMKLQTRVYNKKATFVSVIAGNVNKAIMKSLED